MLRNLEGTFGSVRDTLSIVDHDLPQRLASIDDSFHWSRCRRRDVYTKKCICTPTAELFESLSKVQYAPQNFWSLECCCEPNGNLSSRSGVNTFVLTASRRFAHPWPQPDLTNHHKIPHRSPRKLTQTEALGTQAVNTLILFLKEPGSKQ